MSQDADVDTPAERNKQHICSVSYEEQSDRITPKNRYFLNIIKTAHRRTSSLVRRKFNIGAKAVGSLSINI